MTEEIIIDGIKYFKQSDINKGLDEEHYVTEFHLLATHYNLLLEDYARKYNSLKGQLKRKEQECEELKQWKEDAENLFKTQTDNADKIINRYKQALDEIENSLKTIMETNRVYPLQANLQKVLNSINKAKEQ